MDIEIRIYTDDDCRRCDGSGYEPLIAYTPSFEELMNVEPRVCLACRGIGKQSYFDYG